MKIKMFKKASVVLTLAFFVTGCTTQADENDVPDSPATVEQLESENGLEGSEESTDTESQPDLVRSLLGDDNPKGQWDANKGVEMSLLLENKPLQSHYKEILSKENQEIYEGLTQAIHSMAVNYIIDKPVDPESVRQMMRIILLDEPEYFYLKDYYSYQLDEYSNVVKISFNYQMSPEDRDVIENDYITANSSLYSSLEDGTTQLEQFELILGRMDRMTIEPYVEREDFEGNLGHTFLPVVSSEYNSHAISPQGLSKALNFFLRKSGIPSISVYGNYVTNDFAIGDITYPTGEFSEHVAVDGNIHNVSLDSNDVYVWNLVQINENWYHVDMFYNRKIKEVISSALAKNGETSERTSNKGLELGINMSDKATALGRMFFVNEEILGIQPMSRNNNFNFVVRNSFPFIKQSPTNELRAKINQELNKGIFQFKPNKFSLTFEDADNYQQANEELDAIIHDIEAGVGVKIKEYKTLQLTGSATIYFYGIIYE